MLEIITDSGVRLETAVDMAITLFIENPFTAEGRIPLPYSTSFDLPPTATNLREFRYPNRLGTYASGSNLRSISCIIRFNSLVIAKGKLNLISYDERLKVNFSGADFNENHRAPIYTTNLDEESIAGTYNTVAWNTVGNYAYNYRAWATNKKDGSDARFVIAPIARKSSYAEPFRWADKVRRDGSEMGIYRSLFRVIQNYYYNAFNVSSQNFMFSNSRETYHAPILPQFRVHYLLSKLIGGNLLNNPFSQGRMKDLVIPTYYHPKYLLATIVNGTGPLVSNIGSNRLPTGPPVISFEDFFPNVGANDFIREVLNLFCYTLYAAKGGYAIVSNTDIINKPVVHNWTNQLIGRPVISSEEGKFYDYGFETGRTLYTTESTPTTVATIQAMVTQAVSLDDGFYDNIFFITETSQYFQKSAWEESYRMNNTDVKELIVEYTFLGYRGEIPSDNTDKERFSVKVNINTPHLHPAVYLTTLENTGGTKQYMVVPQHAALDDAMYNSSEGFKKREENFEILLYDGNRTVATHSGSTAQYPYLNPYGSNEVPLIWEGENGLIEKYHKPFKTWIEKDKLKLQGTFLLNTIELHQLDITNKVHVNGRNFYIQKLQYTLTNDRISPVEAHLIEV